MIELPKRYKPKTVIAGGMSSVVHCDDLWLKRPVVVKFLDPETDQRRLLDAIQALQAIRSSYVVQIYDVITDDNDDIVGVVEEYCEGHELSDVIGRLDTNGFVKLGYQLIAGIAEVHRHGIIHRDIKPNNVLVGGLNRLTIIDFGLARPSSGARTVSAIGTSGFMAPELFTPDKNGDISFTSAIDVFAFASSMYLLSEGSLPRSLRKRPPDLTTSPLDFGSMSIELAPTLAKVLNSAHSDLPKQRPTAKRIQEEFYRVLVRGKHRALLNIATGPRYLDSNSPRASASIPGLAALTIVYDGDQFTAQSVSGEIYVNAGRVQNGFVFPGSCVIAFGNPDLGARRQYITFDVSHPGVSL